MLFDLTLPKDISRIGQEIKLFGKWDTQEYASIGSYELGR